VAGREHDEARRDLVDLAAVGVLGDQMTLREEAGMRMPAEAAARDRPHLLAPAPAGRVDDALQSADAGLDLVDDDAADLRGGCAGDGCGQIGHPAILRRRCQLPMFLLE
jgi:hypothetical protein